MIKSGNISSIHINIHSITGAKSDMIWSKNGAQSLGNQSFDIEKPGDQVGCQIIFGVIQIWSFFSLTMRNLFNFT